MISWSNDQASQSGLKNQHLSRTFIQQLCRNAVRLSFKYTLYYKNSKVVRNLL